MILRFPAKREASPSWFMVMEERQSTRWFAFSLSQQQPFKGMTACNHKYPVRWKKEKKFLFFL